LILLSVCRREKEILGRRKKRRTEEKRGREKEKPCVKTERGYTSFL